MVEDRERWNEKHANKKLPTQVLELLEQHTNFAKKGTALDIACGQGRNSYHLAQNGFNVDAVDISNVALEGLTAHQNISTIEADLDSYVIEENRYDIIVNSYFLHRRLFPYMIDGLKKEGILIFETFLQGEGTPGASNPDFLLRKNELLHAFLTLQVLHYKELLTINSRGENVMVAQLVAKKS